MVSISIAVEVMKKMEGVPLLLMNVGFWNFLWNLEVGLKLIKWLRKDGVSVQISLYDILIGNMILT